jgi:hypothetical protein
LILVNSITRGKESVEELEELEELDELDELEELEELEVLEELDELVVFTFVYINITPEGAGCVVVV